MSEVKLDRYNKDVPEEKPAVVKQPPPQNSAAQQKGNLPLKIDPLQYSEYVRGNWPYPSEEAMSLAPTHMKLFYDVRESNVPNYMKVKREVPSELNCDRWDELMKGKSDVEICKFLRYGWPVTYTAPVIPTSTTDNHSSATRNPKVIDSFIKKEKEKNALLGPFKEPPFRPWTKISPLMTRDKPDGSGKRVIIDLSFPEGASVNDGILKNFHQGADSTYSLPTALDLADQLLQAGRGAFMWKSDLTRAYRQLRIDPLDYPLLAIKHDNAYYLDVCPSFGCRASGGAQQRVSNAVVDLMKDQGHTILAYVDDFCGVGATHYEATSSFKNFHSLTDELGLKLAPEKTKEPATSMEWLGFLFNSQTKSITIPQAKLDELLAEADVWLKRKRATRQQIQSLAGRLNHISLCVRPARKFMARILATLREATQETSVAISEEFRRDVRWFCEFARATNTRLLIEPKLPMLVIECDACLVGAGGFSNSHFYEVMFPTHLTATMHISQLEALNVVLALKTLLPPLLTSTRVLVKTDNIAAMYALSTGRTRDPILAACAREIWLIAAVRQLDILIEHFPGDTLVLADALSRSGTNPSMSRLAKALVVEMRLSCSKPVPFEQLLTLGL